MPKMNEELKVHGSFIGTMYRENGDVEVIRKDNIILKSGFDFICDALCASSGRPSPLGYIAVGTGNTAPADTQTTLSTEVARKATTYAHTAGTKVFTLSTTFLPGEATAALVEAGVFNAAAAGIAFDRVTFGVITKGDNDTFNCQFQFTLV